VAITRLPEGSMQTLGSRATLIAVQRGGVPVLQAPRLTRAAQIMAVQNADRFCQALLNDPDHPALLLATLHSTLLGGVTATLNADEQFAAPRIVAGQTVRRSVQLDLYRPREPGPGKAALQAALIVEDLVQASSPNPAESTNAPPSANGSESTSSAPPPKPPTAPVMQREMSLFDPPAGNAFAMIVPIQFDGSAANAIAMVVEIGPGNNSPQERQDQDRSLAQIALREAREQASLGSEAANNPDLASLQWALDALQKPASKRRDLLFLADQTGAAVCRDLVLLAHDDVLEELARRIVQEVRAVGHPKSKEALGWLLEKTAYQWTCEALSAGTLPPELTATLTLHTGEAGRHPGSVDEALRQATSFKDLQTRLIAENLIYLEDSSPGARVRAFDFLQAQRQAPAGYDPLGPATQRADALDKALNAAGAGGTP
jgi:hypothetical protein